jgi:Na+-transporting methylmalonyl-CoA/oxaloacetate decarboxylase gamma subunit
MPTQQAFLTGEFLAIMGLGIVKLLITILTAIYAKTGTVS